MNDEKHEEPYVQLPDVYCPVCWRAALVTLQGNRVEAVRCTACGARFKMERIRDD